jgi:hypothetical protein
MSITGVEMFYGDYQLKPAPVITVGREIFKQPDGTVLGGGYRVTLNGSLLPGMIEGTGLTAAEKASFSRSFTDLSGHQFDGPDNSMSIFRAKDDFLYAFNIDRKLFHTKFLGEGALCSGYPIYGAPRVVSIEFNSEDQWTTRLDYTVELFFNNSMSTGTGPITLSSSDLVAITGVASGAFDYIAGDLQSYTREYSVETMAKGAQIGSGYMPSFFQVSVNTSAQVMEGTGAPYSGTRPTLSSIAGVGGYSPSTGISNFIGIDSLSEVMSGYLGATAFSGLKGIHTDSNYSYNKAGGNYNYSDTFVVYGVSGDLRASGLSLPDYPVMDTPTLEVEGSLENAIVTVTTQGELRGFVPYHGDTITGAIDGLGPWGDGIILSESIANAQRYLDEAAYTGNVSGRNIIGAGLFYNRVCNAYSGLNFPAVALLPLQPEPIAQSISYNTREATIGYSFTYTNRPANCYSDALHETINISRGNPSEVNASITILGRAKGPILQDIGTITSSTTEVNIEAVIVPDTGIFCTGDMFAGVRTTGLRNFYSGLLNSVELNLSGEYGTYFTTSDNETYDPKTGRYSRTKGWVHSLC